MNRNSITKQSFGVIGVVVIVHATSVVSLENFTINCNQQEKIKICQNIRSYNYGLSDNLDPKIGAYLNNSDSSSVVTFRFI